nr:MAG TPA: Putative transcription factor PCF6 domain, hypothetical protein [Bacteriophage sp.]
MHSKDNTGKTVQWLLLYCYSPRREFRWRIGTP